MFRPLLHHLQGELDLMFKTIVNIIWLQILSYIIHGFTTKQCKSNFEYTIKFYLQMAKHVGELGLFLQPTLMHTSI